MKIKQKQLNLKYFRYYYSAKIDGLTGPIFKKATKKFQNDYNLSIDGSFGPKTIKKSIEVIKELQNKLNKETKLNLKIDGYIGNKTISAIKVYQKNNFLKIDGVCGPTTYNYLYNNETKKFTYPLNYIRITSEFGYRSFYKRFHYGLDLGKNTSSNNRDNYYIYAGDNLKIIKKGKDTSAGNFLICKSNYSKTKDLITSYFHLSEIPSFNIGTNIKKNEGIGLMGKTGNSTGYHLHIETWIVPKNYNYSSRDRKKYAVNPISVLHVDKHQQFIIKINQK